MARPIAHPMSEPRMRVTAVSPRRVSNKTTSADRARPNTTFNGRPKGSGCSSAAAYATAATNKARASANHDMSDPAIDVLNARLENVTKCKSPKPTTKSAVGSHQAEGQMLIAERAA